MPIRGRAGDAGIFDTSDLALLGRVFDKLTTEGRSAAEEDAIASRIIGNYMAGITDEAELISLSKQPLGR